MAGRYICDICEEAIANHLRKCVHCNRHSHLNCARDAGMVDYNHLYYCEDHINRKPSMKRYHEKSVQKRKSINNTREFCKVCMIAIGRYENGICQCISCLDKYHNKCLFRLGKEPGPFICFTCRGIRGEIFKPDIPDKSPTNNENLNKSSDDKIEKNEDEPNTVRNDDKTQDIPPKDNTESKSIVTNKDSTAPKNTGTRKKIISSTPNNDQLTHVSPKTASPIDDRIDVALRELDEHLSGSKKDKESPSRVGKNDTFNLNKDENNEKEFDMREAPQRLMAPYWRKGNRLIYFDRTNSDSIKIKKKDFRNDGWSSADDDEIYVVHPDGSFHPENPKSPIEKIKNKNFDSGYNTRASRTRDFTAGLDENDTSLKDILLINAETNYLAQTEAIKSRLMELPKVKTIGPEWLVFYRQYCDTKHHFSDYENALRVTKAIECEKIKEMGGINLFIPEACDLAVENIHLAIGKGEFLLSAETQKFYAINHKFSLDNKSALLSFMRRIINYVDLCEKGGHFSLLSNTMLIAKLISLLPGNFAGRWSEYAANIELNGQMANLRQFADWLKNRLPGIQREVIYSSYNVTNMLDNKKKDFNNQKKSTFSNRNRVNNHHEHSEAPDTFKCWFHKSNDHFANGCRILLSKNGRDVSLLARKANICTFCGSKRHNEKCPNIAKIPECKFCKKNHRILYCFKRYGQENNEKNRENNEHENNQNSNRKSVYYNRNYTENSEASDKNENDHEKLLDDDKVFDLENSSDGIANQLQTHKHVSHDFSSQRNNKMKSNECSKFYLNDKRASKGEINMNRVGNFNFMMRSSLTLNHGTDVWQNEISNSKCNVQNDKISTCVNLLSVIVIKLANINEEYAFLLDSGSTISLIEQDLADKLELYGYHVPLELGWSGSVVRKDNDSRIVQTVAKGIHPNAKCYDIYFHTVKDLAICDQKFNAKEMKTMYKYLEKLNLANYCTISGIIGIDQAWIFDLKRVAPKRMKFDCPLGYSCPLGDFVVGSGNSIAMKYNFLMNENDKKLIYANENFHTRVTLNEMTILKQWEDNILGYDYLNVYEDDRNLVDDEIALNLLRQNVKRYHKDEEHFVAPLLWKNPDVILPTDESFKMSLKRLRILEKHLIKLNLYEDARNEIANLLKKGYATELSINEIKTGSPKEYYNPIFFINPKQRRLRMIWDFAAKIENKSLNDNLLAGPNLYADLLKLLFGMREGKYLFKGDLMEMFHQIYIREDDRDALRFMFSDSPGGKLRFYQMNVMVFGAVSSPCTSQFVKNLIAEENEKNYPKISKLIKNYIYVDDLLLSVNSLNEAQNLLNDTRNVLKSGGFNLVKLNSNDKRVLDLVKLNANPEDLSNPKFLSGDDVEKILGYTIDFNNDTIAMALTLQKISENIINGTKRPTKKEVLQFTMSFYDPLGLYEFFVSKLKLFYHWICVIKIEWHEIINENLFKIWKKILKWTKELPNIKVSRPLSTKITETCNKELWMFTDAGKEVLCAVAYLRLSNKDNMQLDVQIIGAKSFVVPCKQNRSTPELELDIVDKAIKFLKKIIEFHTIKFDLIHLVTDSTCVYGWLINGMDKPTIYAHNRLDRINNCELKLNYKWISTKNQPADFGTKFSAMPKLISQNEWFYPCLFALPEGEWPDFKPPITLTENLNIHSHTNNEEKNSLIQIDRYSTLNDAIKRVRLLLRWKVWLKRRKLHKRLIETQNKINNSRQNKIILKEEYNKLKNELEIIDKSLETRTYERENALLILIRIEQFNYFENEIKSLERNGRLLRENKFYKFNLKLDKSRILRVTTRLASSDDNLKHFSYDRMNPILLPKNAQLTKLIILQEHVSNAHMLNKSVAMRLMEKYYIPNINWTISKIIKNECYECRRVNARPQIPMMGDLPIERLGYLQPPFTYTMIDVAGPFEIMCGRKYGKRWLMVMSCLTTRAIHIEILDSMDAKTSLYALLNFCYIRGKPLTIISDNGTNFVGANRNLQLQLMEHNKFLEDQGKESISINWEFHPAKGSYMNGAVERMIGLIKNAMKRLVKEIKILHARLDETTLRHMIHKIIYILNSRPISMIPIEGTNTFLTPNLFLMNRPDAMNYPIISKCTDIDLNKFKNEIDTFIKILWQHWLKAYVPTIMMREKWIEKKKKLEKGDIVVTADPSSTNSWRLGVITDLIEGSRDQVRKVEILLGKNAIIKDRRILNDRKKLLEAYRNERTTRITRPASLVAPLNLKSEAFAQKL